MARLVSVRITRKRIAQRGDAPRAGRKQRNARDGWTKTSNDEGRSEAMRRTNEPTRDLRRRRARDLRNRVQVSDGAANQSRGRGR